MAFSKLEKVLLAKLGIDVARSPVSRKVAYKLALAGARLVAPATVPIASALSPYAPIAAGAALGGYALQTDPGQQLLAAAEERGRQDRLRFERLLQDTIALAPIKRKRRMSKFNQSVKKGMSMLKSSPSYGKKGSISNAKKAFSAVTKTVSKVMRGKPKPKTGVLKKVAAAAAKIMTPKPSGRTAQRAKAKKAREDYERYRRSKAGRRR